jgi:pantoate--beta-alanine ligase
MQILKTQKEVDKFLEENKTKSIGFVPTMGALHDGHLSLLNKAKAENNLVICSIFINPTQFNDQSDFQKYPRSLESDLKMLEKAETDAVFCPEVAEIYPDSVSTKIEFETPMMNILEGKFRPGHFLGVATVVKRLFEIVRPARAYFGKKDYQQVKIIQQMVSFYNLPVKIVTCETLREISGLAMSSRNMRLSPEELEIAPKIYEVLQNLKSNLNSDNFVDLLAKYRRELQKNFQVEYLELCDQKNLSIVQKFDDKPKVILIAAWLGQVRLIDNLEI